MLHTSNSCRPRHILSSLRTRGNGSKRPDEKIIRIRRESESNKKCRAATLLTESKFTSAGLFSSGHITVPNSFFFIVEVKHLRSCEVT